MEIRNKRLTGDGFEKRSHTPQSGPNQEDRHPDVPANMTPFQMTQVTGYHQPAESITQKFQIIVDGKDESDAEKLAKTKGFVLDSDARTVRCDKTGKFIMNASCLAFTLDDAKVRVRECGFVFVDPPYPTL